MGLLAVVALTIGIVLRFAPVSVPLPGLLARMMFPHLFRAPHADVAVVRSRLQVPAGYGLSLFAADIKSARMVRVTDAGIRSRTVAGSTALEYQMGDHVMKIRAVGIPLWVTIFVGFFMIFSTVLGVRGLIDPTTVLGYFEGADRMALTWAGRNAGIGLAMAVAFLTRNPAAYAATLLAGTLREIGDLLSALEGASGEAIGIGILTAVDFSAFLLSVRAVIKTNSGAAAKGQSTPMPADR